jgi:hypothetical protein
MVLLSRLGGVLVSLLAIRPKVRGFNPGRSDKRAQHNFIRSGSKAGGPTL